MKRFAIIALTSTGAATARRLATALQAQPLTVDRYFPQRLAQNGENYYRRGEFTATMHRLFKEYDCVVCIMATGIVVRSLTGVIIDKTVDPAVIVMDEQANHVISLLSGHVGGANEWTRLVARLLQTEPVITTATDTEHVQSLDMLAKHLNGWYPNFKINTKRFNRLLAEKKPVELFIEPYLTKYVGSLAGFTVLETPAQHQVGTPLVIVSDHSHFAKNADAVQVVPRVNVLGVGCRKGVTNGMMQQALTEFCTEHQLLWRSIGQLASIELKRKEGALQYLATTLNAELEFFTAQQLQEASTHYPASPFVLKTVGVGNVACAAADFASGARTVTKRYANHEITMAMSRLNEI
ncbi:cobalt-precorrin 5A hydrolase [Limosilactobacillus kribbianus]|jgi:cobalt-precorrin 5A hydrolase|uniref:cobalt-precorrin 5A hydrolase n=1 Tax=Limosilactobacillus kribbianus TaxID=2982695 RepID=UPI00226468CB|nr:cobalamin biosynthesis protein [Limosilactobacillus kribbianus]